MANKTANIPLRTTPEEKLAFISHSSALGLSLNSWIRAVLRLEVGLNEEEPRPPGPEVTMAIEPNKVPDPIQPDQPYPEVNLSNPTSTAVDSSPAPMPELE